MSELVSVASTEHRLEIGDTVRMSVAIPRPAWWKIVALWKWWHGPLEQHREYKVTSVVESTVYISPQGDP